MKPIIITVKKGIVQEVENVPSNIEIEVRDYDNKDGNGQYTTETYNRKPKKQKKRNKLIINRKNFLSWIYSDKEDRENLAEIIIQQLHDNGKVKYDMNAVYFSAGYIPVSLIQNERDISPEDLKDNEYTPQKTDFVKWI